MKVKDIPMEIKRGYLRYHLELGAMKELRYPFNKVGDKNSTHCQIQRELDILVSEKFIKENFAKMYRDERMVEYLKFVDVILGLHKKYGIPLTGSHE